ncbi:DUF2716 domain-containing protein [Streptomyces sp. A1547]|uniref:DUF2716 domain-containing protein n=1 Tax=Streptomyces sp. A1547 TaxID=2563105 RepID=UPI00109E9052|nr:DUF2716 domain-containing protein [Streptomyces sp. A1547]THA28869.1 DUF2716 domain-containing protein [Streptomyces sp. A1547]
MDMGERWTEYDGLRGRVPSWHPVGVVVQADGPVVRRHYGTHGTAEHAPLAPGTDLASLVRRQQEAFADRDEPVEWKVYGHDAPDLGLALTAAGFTPGWERSVLIAEELTGEPDVVAEPRNEIRSLYAVQEQAERAWEIAVGSPAPHAVPYAEMIADGASEHGDVFIDVLVRHGEVTAVGWVYADLTRPFKIVGGLSGDDADFVQECTAHWRTRASRPLLAEAAGPLRERLLKAGFIEAATARSYHWRPTGTPETTRPAQVLDWLLDAVPLWDRLFTGFDFKPNTTSLPAISAPVPSAVWHLHAHHRPVPDLPEQIDAIVQRGLLTATEPGEFIYWLDWQHDGYRYDPRRTDLPGRPPRPGKGAYPNGDYYLHLTDDLRLGTFGHPWEQTLTVWGPPLLAAVEAELTELLGEPVRRRD